MTKHRPFGSGEGPEDGDSSSGLMLHQAFTANSGPLPPAQEMEFYERIMPGSAERIFAMAEKEQNHRHQREKDQQQINERTAQSNILISDSNVRAQDANIKEIRRGQWMAFALALLYLASTVGLAAIGSEVVASAMTLSGVAAVATVFIKVRTKQ